MRSHIAPCPQTTLAPALGWINALRDGRPAGPGAMDPSWTPARQVRKAAIAAKLASLAAGSAIHASPKHVRYWQAAGGTSLPHALHWMRRGALPSHAPPPPQTLDSAHLVPKRAKPKLAGAGEATAGKLPKLLPNVLRGGVSSGKLLKQGLKGIGACGSG